MPLSRSDRIQTILWIALGSAFIILLWLLGPILMPFAIAAVFAYICDPVVNWLVARRVPRPVAVLLVIFCTGLIISLLTLTLLPMLYREAVALIRRLPDLIILFNTHLSPRLQSWFGTDFQLDTEQFRRLIAEHWDRAQDIIPIVFQHLKTSGGAIVSVLLNLFLIPVVMFYLLQTWPRLLASLNRIVPRPLVKKTNQVLSDIDSILSEFLRGQLSVMALLAIYYTTGLWIAGVNFALPVGVLTGLLIFIPYIGFGSGLLLAIMTALLQGEGWSPLIGVGIVYGIGQLLESFLLTPYLVGERIGLHPLAVIFALMAFGQLFGFTGMLVALPASAAILVGLREILQAWFNSALYLGQKKENQQTSPEP